MNVLKAIIAIYISTHVGSLIGFLIVYIQDYHRTHTIPKSLRPPYDEDDR